MPAALIPFPRNDLNRFITAVPLVTGVLGYGIVKYWQHPAAPKICLLLWLLGFAVAATHRALRTPGYLATLIVTGYGIATGIAVATFIGEIFAVDGPIPVLAYVMLAWLAGLVFFLVGGIVVLTRHGGWRHVGSVLREEWGIFVMAAGLYGLALAAGVL